MQCEECIFLELVKGSDRYSHCFKFLVEPTSKCPEYIDKSSLRVCEEDTQIVITVSESHPNITNMLVDKVIASGETPKLNINDDRSDYINLKSLEKYNNTSHKPYRKIKRGKKGKNRRRRF